MTEITVGEECSEVTIKLSEDGTQFECVLDSCEYLHPFELPVESLLQLLARKWRFEIWIREES